MKDFIKTLDENLEYLRHETDGDIVRIHVVSARRAVVCPYCGAPSGHVHSYYVRKFRDLPVMGKKTEIVLRSRKMYCANPSCSRTTFAERFDSFSWYGRKTKRLMEKIMDIAAHTSSVAASEILSDGIADVGKSAICSYIKNVPVPARERVEKVCIDDFAYRKRYRYGTVMVDAEGHRIVDMLPSRDSAEVTQWLKTFPNLSVVSRDGSSSYRKAIEDTGMEITQVSDRFHLVKGLTEAAKAALEQAVPANIGLSKEDAETDCGYWDRETKETLAEENHKKTLKKKVEMVEKVRKLHAAGLSKQAVSRETGLCYRTVTKYLNPDYVPRHSRYGASGASPLKPFADTIRQFLTRGLKFREIEQAVREQGYQGASSTIRMFASRERRLLKQAGKKPGESMEKVARKSLVSLLYRPLEDVKGITEEQLKKITERFPIVSSLLDCVSGFKDVLFSKKPEKLETWMNEAEQLNIPELASFLNGLRRDMTAVKNAIALDYNNGLAEGSVNKIKVIKRTMFGRCSNDLLRAKVLRLEARRPSASTSAN